jgi:hypothetical protein
MWERIRKPRGASAQGRSAVRNMNMKNISLVISDPFPLWVNGMEVTNVSGGNWYVVGVPLNAGGTAVVQARAIPTSDNGGHGAGGSGGASSTYENPGNPASASATDVEVREDKGPEVVVELYTKFRIDRIETTDSSEVLSDEVTESIGWFRGQAGSWFGDECWGVPGIRCYRWTHASWNEKEVGQVYGNHWHLGETCGNREYVDPLEFTLPGSWPGESCGLSAARPVWDVGPSLWLQTRSRSALTLYTLRTGGKAWPSRKNLFVGIGGVEGVGNHFWPEADNDKQGYAIDPTTVVLGSLGSLGIDGRVYKDLLDGVTYDITPKVEGNPYYTYGPQQTKHKLRILANGEDCRTDFFFNRPTFIVGQYVTFSSTWDQPPPNVESTTNNWNLAGNYKNAWTNAVPSGQMIESSDVYFADPNALTNEVVPNNWWVSGGLDYPASYAVKLDKGLPFNNGQHVLLSEEGSINMWRPKAKITAATGTVSLDTDFMSAQNCVGIFGLHYGVPSNCGGTPGIAFSNSITVPIGFSGSIQWVQVINSFSLRYQANDGSEIWYRWSDTNGLDGAYPYSSNVATEDSPGVSIDQGGANCWVAKNLTSTADFDMWLEFQPPGGHWVPLRKVNWSWGGGATLVGTDCLPSDWTGENFTNTPNPSDFETEEYARWTKLITNVPNYQPE